MALNPEEETVLTESTETEIPDESVVDETGDDNPQSSEEAEEFEVDIGESDEQETSKASAQAPVYKLNKLRKRAQKAEKEVGATSAENVALKAQLDALEKSVAKVTAGPRPDPYDYDSVEAFRAADDSYNAAVNSPAKTDTQPVNQQPVVQANDAFFDAHYEEAAKLPLKKGEFEEAEGSFRTQFNEAFGDKGQLLADAVLQEAGDKSPLVAVALGKNENEANKLIKALTNDAKNGTRTAEKLIWKLSEKAALKPKRNRVATDPTDIPKGASNAGSLSNKITKASEVWRANPTVANSKKLNDLRKQQNG